LFQACDTVDNIDQEVYEQMSQCAAYVLEVIKLIKVLIKNAAIMNFVCIGVNDERRASRVSEQLNKHDLDDDFECFVCLYPAFLFRIAIVFRVVCLSCDVRVTVTYEY
jgi:hypothetical protein